VKKPQAREFLEPALGGILISYIRIMSEIESEDLVNALNQIVKYFDKKITPHSVELTQQLVINFKKLNEKSPDQNEIGGN
jgi:hypothetical protein